jgi:hypothetical protein
LSDSERQLLLAACADGARTEQSWQRWSAGADLDRLTPDEFALLPLAYRNLEPHAPEDPLFRKAFAIYRQTWLANQLALRRAAELGSALASRGIDHALAGAGALALVAYPDPGARPIAGLDFLVDPERLREATDAASSVALGTLAVRWHAQLPPGVTRRFAGSLRAAAVPISVGGGLLKVLVPPDLLLIASEQICAWDAAPRALFLADAWRLLGALREPADVVRALEQAQAERVTLTLRITLAELEFLGAASTGITELRRRLEERAPGLLERWEYRCKHRAPGPIKGRGLSLMVLRHLRARAAGDRQARLPALPILMLRHVAARLRERSPSGG